MEKGGTTLANTKAVSKKPASALKAPAYRSTYVKNRPLYLIAAFLIPALLTFIAYALFGVYPFNGRSVLTLDLNGQYVYYFEAIRDAFWTDKSALYSWQRNLSGGFQGVIGYYLASPFTFIVILLPKKFILESLMIMQLCKVGAAGSAFCYYVQKSKRVAPLQSVIFSTMYALMAYVVIQMIDPMWLDGPIFLPLIILGVEYLIDDGRKVNYIIPLAIMFIANFYIGFMIAIFVAIYFVYYLFFGTERKMKAMDYVKTIALMGLATAVVLMCSYIMIVPVYNALALGKFDFSQPDYSFRTMFNPIELVPTLLPDQYYSVNVDEGTRLYGRPEIYCGVLSAVLVPFYYINKNIRINRKIGYSLMLFVMFFSMYIKPVNMMWHGGQDPNWLPYRYSFLVSFILVSMAAEAFAKLEGYEITVKPFAGTFIATAVLIFLFEAKMPSFNYNEEKYKYVAKFPYTTNETYDGESFKHLWLGTLAFGLILAGVYLTLVYIYTSVKKKKAKTVISLIVAAIVIFEAGYNTYDTIWKVHKEVYYSDHDTFDVIKDAPALVDELEAYDGGLYRSEKTFFRSVNDNQAWGLKGISHSSSVMNARILSFIETLGYTTKSYETRYDGNTPVADSLLGIKYVFDDPAKHDSGNGKSLLSPTYNKIYSSTYTNDSSERVPIDVYENPDALPIGFAASTDITRLSYLGNDNPFNSMNNFLSSMTGNTPDYSGALEPRQYFKRIAEPQVDLNECWESDYNGQHCYNANAEAVDPTVRIHITAESEDPLYMFLKSDNPKKCNMWVSTTKNEETGEFENFTGYGQYYDGYDYSIVNLGTFKPGTEIEVRLTILQQDRTGANEYIMVKDFQFYHLNYDLFHGDVQALKESPWNIDTAKSNDRYLEGDIDIKEGQLMYTSIPYEPGWTIKVDGKTVGELFSDSTMDNGTSLMVNDTGLGADALGEVVILNAMIGLRLPAGHHTVSMKYTPPGFNAGLMLLVIGLAIVVLFWMYDNKHNAVIAAEKAAAERRKKGLPEPVEESQKTAGEIIREKSAKKAKKAKAEEPEEVDESHDEAESAEEEAEDADDEADDDEEEDTTEKDGILDDVQAALDARANELAERASAFLDKAEAEMKEAGAEAAEAAEDAAEEVKKAAVQTVSKKKKKKK